MRRLLICILLALCNLLDGSIAQAQSDPASEIIHRVNWLRASYGLPAYQLDSVLMYVAQAQASWSAEDNHIGHDGPGGSSPNDRAQAAGYGGGSNSYAIDLPTLIVLPGGSSEPFVCITNNCFHKNRRQNE